MFYRKLLAELRHKHLEQTVIFITASYAGAMANIIDLAPNYGHSGAVLAFCQTIHMSASFLSPLTAGFLVTKEDSIDQWRIFFVVSGIISVVTYIFYQIFGTAEIQSWNMLRPTNEQLDEEIKILSKEDQETKYIPKSK
ncbi:probable small intestine urate exporter isoform X2 [Drosophila grimshawi]|uniref:probable small intestine urate exporter isoform X2 n=1 Tax=Drosophila grimshawi TaxID=7222 RepID=UPI000C870D8B|nr:probable small intestine urate exporter isoform X2 [Drosophila grimshawi]